MSMLLSPGNVFHRRYQVVRCIKSGGMGAIYEVVHLETRRRRALKVMLPAVVANGDMHARFRLEATIAADIESEHIVETFDAGVDEDTGAPFLVMELLRGEDLGSMLKRRGTLPPAEVVAVLAQVASALGRTHAAGVVHRDLKPDNLFVARRDDGTPKIKILDFGIAKVIAEGGQAAARTKIMGTPLYMSPEQIRGDGTVGPRADLYALGHIAFTLLVGAAYWSERARGDDVYALMLKIAGGGGPAATEMAARRGASLPVGLDPWFARATAADPSFRFETAGALVEALANVLGVPVTGSFAPLPSPAATAVHAIEVPADEVEPSTSLLPEPSAIVAESAPSLGAAVVTGPRPVAAPFASSPSLPPAEAPGATRPPPSKRRLGVALAAAALALGGLAAILAIGRAPLLAPAHDAPSVVAAPSPTTPAVPAPTAPAPSTPAPTMPAPSAPTVTPEPSAPAPAAPEPTSADALADAGAEPPAGPVRASLPVRRPTKPGAQRGAAADAGAASSSVSDEERTLRVR